MSTLLLTVDTATRKLTIRNTELLRRGDIAVPVELTFTESSTATRLEEGVAIVFGIKKSGSYTGSLLASCDTWTRPDSDSGAYTGTINLNGSALNTEIANSSALSCIAEVTWNDSEPKTSTVEPVSIRNDLNRADDAPPVQSAGFAERVYNTFAEGANITLTFDSDTGKTTITASGELSASVDWSDITNKPAFGGAALLNVGTTAGTVAAGNHTHAGYLTSSDLSGYVTSASLTTTLGSYVTTSTYTSGLAGKSDTGHTHALSSLSDVSISGTPTTGYVLKWNGTAWSPAADNAGTGGGGGDMSASTYDTDGDGVVDNSEALNGQAASYYLSTDNHTSGTTNKVFTATEKTKLAGVATGATANDTDANLKARANHTGTQTASTISDFNTAADARVSAAVGVSVQAYSSTLTTWAGKTAPSGTVVGTSDTQTLTNKTLTAPAISSPTGLVKADVGLGNVDNTSDSTKNSASATLTNKTLGTGCVIPAQHQVALSDTTTDLTAGTSKVTFRMPYAMTVTSVRLSCSTAPAGSSVIVNVKEAGTTIFSTKPSIAAGSKTSVGGTAAVLSDSSLADDAEITVDIDQVGSSTAGKGLVLTLIGTRTL